MKCVCVSIVPDVFCFHSYNWYSNQFNPSSNSTTNTQTKSKNNWWMKDQFEALTRIQPFQIAKTPHLRWQRSIQIIPIWYKRRKQKIQNIAVSQSPSIQQSTQSMKSHSRKISSFNFPIFPISLGMLPDNLLSSIFCNNGN